MEPRVELHNDDCITGMGRLAEGCISLTVTSIPFGALFVYSGKNEDVGNNPDGKDLLTSRFALNLRFFATQLLRVTAPGCLACIHIQQLLALKNQHGFMGRRDFRGAVIDIFSASGWDHKGEAVIPKDPQIMVRKHQLLSLQFKTGHSRTSTKWAPAPCDFVLIFEKPGEIAVPVRPLVHHRSKTPLARPSFFDQIGRPDDAAYLDYLREWGRENEAVNPGGWMCDEDWIAWAKGTWEDVNEFDVLDGAASAKETEEEKHVCPLQISVVQRCVMMYSNPITIQPDSTVLDPFMGIGTTCFASIGGISPVTKFSVVEPRNVIGFELKESYHRASLNYIEKARRTAKEAAKVRQLF